MNGITAFWQLLYSLQHHVGQCYSVKQSASGMAHQVTYGGSCLQSFLNALYSHGQQAWVYIDGPAGGGTF